MAGFKSVSLADQVFEKLENDIILGVYPRGEILTELKLVDQLGVAALPSGRPCGGWSRSGSSPTPARALWFSALPPMISWIS